MPPPHQQRRPPRPPRRYRRPRPDPSRRVAFEALRAVDERDAYANLVLPGLLADAALDPRDAALATELTYGTLRARGSYDPILAACTDRPLDAIDPPVLDVLRLGAHQLFATRIPAHAAVAATVELARAVLGDGRAKFVNAVLRRATERDLPAWIAAVAPARDRDPVGYLAVAHSHPRWVVSALRDALGGDEAGLEALLAADNARPQVTLAAWPGRSTVEELYRAGAEPGRWSPLAAVLPEGDPGAVPAVRDGLAGVQDEGSQLVALALAAAELGGGDGGGDGGGEVRDRRWLDLCAGPGGKAALLAGLAAGRGAALLAAEIAPHRARLVGRALRTAAGGHLVVTADGREPPWRAGGFDRVLVDAPCTGLGALRRRPEARWRRRPEDVPQLTALQRELLGSALDAVRPGGVVAYVTCSPHLAETRVVAGDVTKRRADVERLDARPLFPGVPELGEGPDVQLWPHRHGTDAMYLALLRRR